jgi:hypothetical protein
MNEKGFRARSCFRANDGWLRHEKHEISLEIVLSCLPSCTDFRFDHAIALRGQPGQRLKRAGPVGQQVVAGVCTPVLRLI